jgi:hypothetical protein
MVAAFKPRKRVRHRQSRFTNLRRVLHQLPDYFFTNIKIKTNSVGYALTQFTGCADGRSVVAMIFVDQNVSSQES